MEAGYDYLLLRGRLQRKLLKYVGIIIFVFGALLLASGGAYYGYAAKARTGLDNLNVSTPGAVLEAGQYQAAVTLLNQYSGVGAATGGLAAKSSKDMFAGDDRPGAQRTLGIAMVLPGISAAAIAGRELYPGDALAAGSWSNPLTYEPPEYREQVLLRGFTPIESGQAAPGGALEPATRLILPSVGIDSLIKELEILDLGESRAYETLDRVVGHIPETVNAGENGSSWFFGHTESPILGEGSVFFNLRQVPEKIRNGEKVYIVTENGDTQYLYLAISSQVVSQDEMKLYDTGRATIHLVSCVPRLVYDHRLIITGELVAQKTKS